MIQSLHIFRKDARHLWLDLALYTVLLICFGLVTPQVWEGATVSNTLLQTFATLLKTLIPITWLVIIARLVHDESLVGDQQFWITRPYTWTSLLGAKLFFLAICIILPFVAMQCFLLLHAGLNPAAAIPGQLLSLLYFALILWLPFTVVASVTATLSRAFMSLLAALILWAGVLTILGSMAGPRMMPPFVFEACSILMGGLLMGILLYQYAVRNTARSRIALVAISLLFLGLFFCFVGMYFSSAVDILIRHHYPVSTNKSLRLTFDARPPEYENLADGATAPAGLFTVNLPVHFEGLDPSARLHDVNASFTIDLPGYHYASPWRPVTVTERSLSLLIPQDIFNHVHGTDVRMHLTVVAQRLFPGKPQIVTVANHFSVPNNGRCVFLTDHAGSNPVCRYPFQSPPPTIITGAVATQSCERSGSTRPGTATFRSISPGTSPDPVVHEPLQLGGTICPGTQLTFVEYHLVDNFRSEFDIPAIILAHYTVH